MTVAPHVFGVRVTTGSWPRRRFLIVDKTGYAVGGNVNFRAGLGAQMLAAARRHLMRGSTNAKTGTLGV